MGWRLVRRPDIRGKIAQVKQASYDFASEVGEYAIEEHRKYVANWSDRPDFEKSVTRGLVPKVKVFPTGSPDAVQHWYWVCYGTGERGGGEAYDIEPKTETGVLAFRVGYVPKTTRRSHGGPGTASGPVVFTKKVKDHRGTAPRRFDRRASVAVFKKLAGKFGQKIRKVLFRR